MDYFLNTSCSEGLGVHWAWDGISLGQYDLTSCSLCKQEDCEVAEIEKCYQNKMWYLGLATSSRYKCINQKQSGRRNVIAFVGDTVVVHLGSTPRKLQAFLIFDRKHIHRLLGEFSRGNTLHLGKYETKCADLNVVENAFYFPYRAMWSHEPQHGLSRLFHRWLLLEHKELQEEFTCVEHDNDIPLDCREKNLRASRTSRLNSIHVHRLKHAYWKAGLPEMLRIANHIEQTQQEY